MAAPKDGDVFHPGAAPFGNFINYYSFNPPEKRMKFLPDDLFDVISNLRRKKLVSVLDIGCNTGNLTLALFKHLTESQHNATDGNSTTGIHVHVHPEVSGETVSIDNVASPGHLAENSDTTRVHVLGCDIDDTLIERANESNTYDENISFLTLDFMCDTSRNAVLTNFLSTRSDVETKFDLVCCFSVTMWIHLQHGDSGLCKFLREAAAMSRFLLVEPQPWKCYKSAVRRVRKVGIENSWRFKELIMRERVDEEIRIYLTSICQMELVRTLGETHWDRQLLLFRNTQNAGS